MKLFLTGISPEEYQAHRGFAFTGRHLRGVGPRVACQMQSLDELRHFQTQIHTISHYNKYFDGIAEFPHMHDRVWYLSVPKSFFDDARTAGPFEFMIAIGFAFEYVLTNLLFVPFMSGAAYNGDMSTVTFGFSAQSDESRHMTLGIEVIKFLLEQHPDNLPIVQKWVDKWFWRGYPRARPRRHDDGLHAAEEGDVLEGSLGDLLHRSRRIAVPGSRPLRPEVRRNMPMWRRTKPSIFRIRTGRSSINTPTPPAFHTWMPDKEHLDWLSEKYPNTFDKYYRPRWEMWAQMEKEGKRFYNMALPQLCQTCQIPMAYTEPGDPTTICFRETQFKGETYHFCSDGCKDIFDGEPEKYVQAWLPVHQIFQGNCGGPTVPDVLAWYKLNVGADNMDYVGSPDEKLWNEWHGQGGQGRGLSRRLPNMARR